MKILRKIYIAAFVLVCFSLFALMPFSHSNMEAEKREAAKLPRERTEDGKLNMRYFDELTDYFSDNFAYRQELATADARIKSTVFHTSNQEKAIVGKNNWLYFNGSLDDYFGRNLLNDREIYAASKTIALMQEYSESKGTKFVFTIAPNKNTLYPENMPSNYLATTEDTNIERLRDKMGESVNYVDLQKTFNEQDKVLYHKWDSHWNNEGATLACDKILSSIDKSHYDYTSEPSQVVENHSGDVWQLIYPSWQKYDENVEYERQHIYTYVNPVESVEDMFIVTASTSGEGSVVMFRDSFGNALLPYVADEYASGVFIKGMPLNVKQIENSSADTLIFELVERNIPNIIAYLPVMDAPRRHLADYLSDGTETVNIYDATSSSTCVGYEDKVSQVVIYGELDPEYVDDETDIFIRIVEPDGTFADYEATPAAYEKPEDGADMSNYYGAYLSKELVPDGSTVHVICRKNGEFYDVKVQDLSYN